MSTNFKIEHGVEIPAGGNKRNTYPLAEMQVGDSFAFDKLNLLNLRSAASYFGARNNRKYSIRCVDPVKREYRCWRIA